MTAYILKTCSTCQRILKELNWNSEIIDIKESSVPLSLLDKIHKQEGSYEAAFSRRAMKYKSMNLKDKKLSDEDYKELILAEYTFLKRPVFEIKNKIFIGNSKQSIQEVKAFLETR